ncbi:MAG TPA: NAD(P)H-dependent oxidoreductase subunit E [Bdellovibrionota bacterium]|nr:NAD(P)H-dependent oxidoreductase subunit E [Bdellovibrionota bacterium]
MRFSSSAEEKFADIVSRYPKSDAALLPVLWLAQEEFDVLTPEVRAYVARKLHLSAARVESVVSFYTLYKTKPMGKHHIQICRNLSCSLRGCDRLMGWVVKNLGIKPSETTPDWEYSYSTVECLAACGGAPAIQIDGDYFENVTEQRLEELIGRLKDNGKNR